MRQHARMLAHSPLRPRKAPFAKHKFARLPSNVPQPSCYTLTTGPHAPSGWRAMTPRDSASANSSNRALRARLAP